MTGWLPENTELGLRRQWAAEMGGPDAVAKHHARGSLTIRERIGHVLDRGSFKEIGRLTGEGEYRASGVAHVIPAPYVMGLGKVNGRPVAIGGEDYTIRGGTSWRGDRRKGGQGGFIEDMALQYSIPLINLIDGAGGSVASIRKRGHAVFPGVDGFERSVELMSHVPVISAVMGVAAGGPAGRALLSHWSVMVRGGSQVFAAGPPVVERSLGLTLTREELGGAKIAVDTAGTIDNVADSEADALEMIRRFLGYFPTNVWGLPPEYPITDPIDRIEADLASIVPADRRKPYDMRRVVRGIFDLDSLFEIQPSFGRGVLTILARLGGKSVGVVANNPKVYGGAMDARAARKQARFIELCDTFHIPIIFLVDLPGFLVGPGAEEAGTLRDGMRAVYVAMQATVPMVTLVIRKCYGMAGMGACDKNGLNFKIGWPTAEIGNLPVEGGVMAAFRREIEAAPDPRQRENEIEQELRQLTSPYRMAEAFAIEEIIDPVETRPYLYDVLEAARVGMPAKLGRKPRYGVRP